jgi:hypothetical protein
MIIIGEARCEGDAGNARLLPQALSFTDTKLNWLLQHLRLPPLRACAAAAAGKDAEAWHLLVRDRV